MKIYYCKTQSECFGLIAEDLLDMLSKRRRGLFNLALSGGGSAEKLFRAMLSKGCADLDWKNVKIFWVDERCVPTSSSESNYANAKRLFLDKIDIPQSNVFRIRGEASPEREAARYSKVLKENIPLSGGVPVFDCIVLGMGADGHTASIFPGEARAARAHGLCFAAPAMGNRLARVSLSEKTIVAAKKILCPIAGKDKRDTFSKVLGQYIRQDCKYPASRVFSKAGDVSVYTDILPFPV